MKLKKLMLFLLCPLLLSGCVNKSQVLINPKTDKSITCSSWGWGWIGAPVALMNYYDCVNKYEKLGYLAAEGVPTHGFGVLEEDETIKGKFNSPAIVVKVFPRSPAENAGMKAGDIIVKKDGANIKSIGDLKAAMVGMKIGDNYQYTVLREDKTIDMSIQAVAISEIYKSK